MSTPTIPTLPIYSLDDDIDDDTADAIADIIASFLSDPFSPDKPILTLCPISVLMNYLVNRWFRPMQQQAIHPLLSFLNPSQRAAMRYKYTNSTHTLIVKHPGMPNGIRRVFPDFLLFHMHSAILSSGVFTPRGFGRISARCASTYVLRHTGLKQAELELRFNFYRWTRLDPHIVFEVGMGQKYESVKADVREWLVTTKAGVRLGVLVYYGEGKVPDDGEEWGENSYEPKNRDGCAPLPQAFPRLTYFFETYRYDCDTKDIKLAQERTYLFRDGERVTPEPIFELARWDFGQRSWEYLLHDLEGYDDVEQPYLWRALGPGSDDSFASHDSLGSNGGYCPKVWGQDEDWDEEDLDEVDSASGSYQEDVDENVKRENVCRIPLGVLQDWIDYDRSQDGLTKKE